MDMLSGSQISSFLSATSLMWASSIVLVMVGLVYFIKYKERHDSIRKSRFFALYMLIIILIILDILMNIAMKNNPLYETIIYKSYILTKFFLNISLIFYVLDHIKLVDNKILVRTTKVILMLIAVICCIILDIDVVLENSGKFYILTGALSNVYNVYAIISNSILLTIIIIFRYKMPKSFCTLCILTFLIYVGMLLFKNITGYAAKESVFVFSLLGLIIFNTTSNQDKKYVNKLDSNKNTLLDINNRRNKLIDRIDRYVGQSLNNMVLYNDELYLTKEYDRELIKNDSKEIEDITNKLADYLADVNDLFLIESNVTSVDNQYQLNTLIDNINAKILPMTENNNISFNIHVDDNSFLNYVGDINKIEKIITNILYSAIKNTGEGQSLDLIIASKQSDVNIIELNITIKSSGNIPNIEMAKLNINGFVELDEYNNSYDLKMIISNELLETLNSKIDIKEEENNIIYSFVVAQGLNDNTLYNSTN